MAKKRDMPTRVQSGQRELTECNRPTPAVRDRAAVAGGVPSPEPGHGAGEAERGMSIARLSAITPSREPTAGTIPAR